MPLVERRYAEALINLSEHNGTVDLYRNDLVSIAGIYKSHPDLKFLLLNPEIEQGEKKETLRKLFEGKIQTELLHFLLLLVDKGRFEHLPGIVDEFHTLADRVEHILNITIYTAIPVDTLQIDRIKEKFKKIYSAGSVREKVVINKSLIGGIKVKIGDKVYDGSLRGRLDDLKEALTQHTR